MQDADVLIIGGGAAGLMCAISAAQRGRNVTVLEGSNKVGKKILMSGGGRCNFTNLHTTPANFLSRNPHFCKSALSRYTPWDFITLVEKHEIPYHEKTLGQLFCDRSSKDIVAMLLDECDKAGAVIHTHCEDTEVEPGFVVRCSRHPVIGQRPRRRRKKEGSSVAQNRQRRRTGIGRVVIFVVAWRYRL